MPVPTFIQNKAIEYVDLISKLRMGTCSIEAIMLIRESVSAVETVFLMERSESERVQFYQVVLNELDSRHQSIELSSQNSQQDREIFSELTSKYKNKFNLSTQGQTGKAGIKSGSEQVGIPKQLTIEERTKLFKVNLNYLAGDNSCGQKIMTDEDYQLLIVSVSSFAASKEIPGKSIKSIKLDPDFVRNKFYKIYVQLKNQGYSRFDFAEFLWAMFKDQQSRSVPTLKKGLAKGFKRECDPLA